MEEESKALCTPATEFDQMNYSIYIMITLKRTLGSREDSGTVAAEFQMARDES